MVYSNKYIFTKKGGPYFHLLGCKTEPQQLILESLSDHIRHCFCNNRAVDIVNSDIIFLLKNHPLTLLYIVVNDHNDIPKCAGCDLHIVMGLVVILLNYDI